MPAHTYLWWWWRPPCWWSCGDCCWLRSNNPPHHCCLPWRSWILPLRTSWSLLSYSTCPFCTRKVWWVLGPLLLSSWITATVLQTLTLRLERCVFGSLQKLLNKEEQHMQDIGDEMLIKEGWGRQTLRIRWEWPESRVRLLSRKGKEGRDCVFCLMKSPCFPQWSYQNYGPRI